MCAAAACKDVSGGSQRPPRMPRFWQQAKLRDKRDDRVTHSRRMGKPTTAPLTLYSSVREGGREGDIEKGRGGQCVSSHLCLSCESQLASDQLMIIHSRTIIWGHKTTDRLNNSPVMSVNMCQSTSPSASSLCLNLSWKN